MLHSCNRLNSVLAYVYLRVEYVGDYLIRVSKGGYSLRIHQATSDDELGDFPFSQIESNNDIIEFIVPPFNPPSSAA